MPESTPKPPELIEAQLAAFAGERLIHHEEKVHVFNNLGAIAMQDPGDVVRVLRSAEYVNDESGESIRLDKGTDRLVATQDQYANYMREVGGVKHEGITGRVQMLRNFEAFASVIDQLRSSFEANNPGLKGSEAIRARKNHPQYLASGLNSQTFVVEHEGRQYVVREAGAASTDSHVKAALIGNNIPHMEHIVAASYAEGVTVAELMAGNEMRNVPAADLEQVTEGQLETFVDTLVAANEAGICIDHKPSNFFYDTKEGFGIIDYHMPSKFSPAQNKASVISLVETVIGNAGTYRFNPETVEDYDYVRAQTVASKAVLEKFKEVCERRFEGEELELILKRVGERIESQAGSIDNYNDPAWVTGQVETTRKFKEDRAKADADNAKKKSEGIEVVPLGWDFV